MSIKINDIPTREQYSAASGQTEFNIPFPFYSSTFVQVFQRGANDAPDDEDDILVEGVDYTITGTGSETGGTVTLTVGATLNDIVTVNQAEPYDRASVFDDINQFSISMNQQLNELTIMTQQLNTRISERMVSYANSELIGDEVRSDNTILPILNDGYIWVGRGNYGDDPDDIITMHISNISGNTSGGVSFTVTQANHNLDRGDWVRFDGTNYVVAQADTAINGECVGVVSRHINANQFDLQVAGHIEDLSAQVGADPAYLPLTAGQAYFLSTSTAGEISTTDPSTTGQVSKPCLIATSTTGGIVVTLERGQIVGNGGTSTDVTPGGNQVVITQAGHTFNVGDWVRVTSANTFALAQANTFANSLVAGLVVETPVDGDADKFILQTDGYTDVLSGLAAAPTHYYLDENTAGAMTATEPTGLTDYSRPVFVNLNSTTGFILEQRSLPVTLNANESFIAVTQAPGFAVGKVLKIDGSGTYAEAQADSLANCEKTVGMVVYSSGNDFIIQTQGYTDKITVGTADRLYYLHATSQGDITFTEPTTAGQVSLPMYKSLTLNSGYIVENRPLVQPITGTGSMLEISSQTAAADAVLTFDDVFSGGYGTYIILFENLVFSASNQFSAQFGTGTGPVTYQTSSYVSTNLRDNSTFGAADVRQTGNLSANGLVLTPEYGGSSALTVLSGEMKVFGPADTGASDYKRATWGLNAQGALGQQFSHSGGVWENATAITSIRFQPSTGTITTGRIRIFAIT